MEDQHPAIGAVLAKKYRIDSVLGSGGMGIVLAATHLQLHEQVAIKLLRGDAGTWPDTVARFLREARVAMKMRGEHVVRVLDVGTLEDGAPFIAMECLKGSDLSRVLRAEGRLPASTAVDYVLQACEAIAEAHALGVIHRDLKPANLFLTWRVDGSPCVKVLDFGVSKIGALLHQAPDPLGSTSDDPEGPRSSRGRLRAPPSAPARADMTRTRALLGSPRYMAPEQLRSPRDVDVRADVWALGAILYELLAGQPPFVGETVEELRAAVDAGSPALLAGVPEGLGEAVDACLRKDPDERCPAIAELVESLAPFASPEGDESVKRVRRMSGVSLAPPAPAETSARTEPDHPTNGPVVRDVRRPMGRAGVAALVLVVAALGAAGLTLRARWEASSAPLVTGSAVTTSTPSLAVDAADSILPLPSSLPAASPVPVQTTASTRAPLRAPLREPALKPPGTAPATAASTPGQQRTADPLKLDAGFLFLDQK